MVWLGILGLVFFGARWCYGLRTSHPGGTPAMVARRAKVPSCGHYGYGYNQTGTPPPVASRQVVSANACLATAFNAGRLAELTVAVGPDDIQETTMTFYRVVGRHTLDVIWETIPKSG